ncbi:MAG: TetR/AcrR family transcriptional regulator [Flavobacteriales bacterium]|nr:TetR/AcrR family transcriptional regulator [Flavobacteriales bacterium]
MKELLSQIKLKVDQELYLKDPDSSDLGRSIISKSIEMIDEMGLEKFTFKKLATDLETTESSIYRYFENKHFLLLYLINWYWTWLEYRLVFQTMNLSSPNEKMKIAIDILTREIEQDSDFSYVNEVVLHKIVVAESTKAYFTKQVEH